MSHARLAFLTFAAASLLAVSTSAASAATHTTPWGPGVAVRLVLATGVFNLPVYCWMQKDSPSVFVTGFFQDGDTFEGSDQADILWETNAPTWWCGGNGNNDGLDPDLHVILAGKGGADIIVSRGYNFSISGGPGADLIYAEDGFVMGDGSGDILIGVARGSFGLELWGNGGSDVVCALPGDQKVEGLLGNSGEDWGWGSPNAIVVDVEHPDATSAGWTCASAYFQIAVAIQEP